MQGSNHARNPGEWMSSHESALASGLINIGAAKFNISAGRLSRDGAPISIPEKSASLLRELVKAAGRTLDKGELLQLVWPDELVDESNLRVHVANLRRALGRRPDGGQYVVNVPGRGYMIVLADCGNAGEGDDRRAASMQRNALPAASRIIGRREAMAELIEDLKTRRLVTLVGAGGIGKTTIARHLMNQTAVDAGRSVFIDLMNFRSGSQILRRLGAGFGVEVSDVDRPEDLAAKLTGADLFAVLDNCEHLVEEIAPMVEALAKGAPDLRLLVTSREPLRVEGEWVRRVKPLEVPPQGLRLTWPAALRYSAIELFADRAEAASDGFEPDAQEVEAIVRVCRQLDGVPLALELVAPHCETLGVHGLLSQIAQRFSLVVQGCRTSLPRHRTLQATLDWSFGLLTPGARRLLVRLSSLTGRFNFAKAVAVCCFGVIRRQDMLDLIAELVNKNMLNVELENSEARYFLLQTTLAYARTKLDDDGDRFEVGTRHVAWWEAELAEGVQNSSTSAPNEIGGNYGERLEDFRRALTACRDQGRIDLAAFLVVHSAPLWFRMSLIKEYRGEVAGLIHAAENGVTDQGWNEHLSRLHMLLGHLLFHTRGLTSEAMKEWDTARALALASKSLEDSAQWHAADWLSEFHAGDYGRMERAVDRMGAVPADKSEPELEAAIKCLRATTLHYLGRQDKSEKLCRELLETPYGRVPFGRAVGLALRPRIAALTALARSSWLRGHFDEARDVLDAALASADKEGTVVSVCYVHAFAAGPIALWGHDWHTLAERMTLLKRESARHSLVYWRSWSDMLGAIAEWKLSGGREADRPELPKDLGPTYVAQLAESLAVHRPEFMTASVAERIRAGRAPWCESELIRQEAVRRYENGEADAPRTLLDLKKAAEIARSQGCGFFELRSVLSLARVLAEAGDNAQAFRQLCEQVGNFKDGCRVPEVVEARALLASLKSGRAPGNIAAQAY